MEAMAMAIFRGELLKKKGVILDGYVSLPEGKSVDLCCYFELCRILGFNMIAPPYKRGHHPLEIVVCGFKYV